ncbi:DUF544-domain-containing protein [Violaceomyces palustris]|uniref:DUF544-domain-containing protein n=1 Tax=Violaceomyces palustris TaxID=1673888 RepID=A0ACD0NQE1_9BASI|nr:DUF544-domain-containing protein [Violaceomyces palustris]
MLSHSAPLVPPPPHHHHHHHHHHHPPSTSSPSLNNTSAEDPARPSCSHTVRADPAHPSPLGPTVIHHHPPCMVVMNPSSSSQPQQAEEAQWSLKEIFWRGQARKIITQNQNGPCSLIALCNILLLRGQIQISPPDRPIVSYSYLSQLVAEFLLASASQKDGPDLGAALTILPRTQRGLDVDVLFSSHDAFSTSNSSQESGETNGAGELALFKLCGVDLVHGWLADPADPDTYSAVLAAASYNRALDKLVAADAATSSASGAGEGVSVSDGQRSGDDVGGGQDASKAVQQAMLIKNFLDSTSTQLTYHGLFVLAQSVPPGSLVALFRNSHVSVLYRRLADEGSHEADTGPEVNQTPSLFNLVTDSNFLMEDEIVWESLVDVDGASSEFYDAKFRKAKLRDGDYVGGRAGAGGTSSLVNGDHDPLPNQDADYALAYQIQQDEQQRIEEARMRRARRIAGQSSSSGRGGGHSVATAAAPSTPPQNLYARYGSGPTIPTEVFTTMRYEPVAATAATTTSDRSGRWRRCRGCQRRGTRQSFPRRSCSYRGSLHPTTPRLVEEALLREGGGEASSKIKAIRLAVKKDGTVSVALREVGEMEGRVKVRIDPLPTRVRQMDLEPLVLNKTDARDLYETARVRVGADLGAGGGACFDVLLWNDERLEVGEVQQGGGGGAGEAEITESSIANVLIELTSGEGIERKKRFITPPSSSTLLGGLLRNELVRMGLVEEERIPLDLVRKSNEQAHNLQLYLCNSLRGVWKVDLDPVSTEPDRIERNAEFSKSSGGRLGTLPSKGKGKEKEERRKKKGGEKCIVM